MEHHCQNAIFRHLWIWFTLLPTFLFFRYWWILWRSTILSFCQHLRIRHGIQVPLFGIYEYGALLKIDIFRYSWILCNGTPLPNCHFSAFMNVMACQCKKCIFRHSRVWYTAARLSCFEIHKYNGAPFSKCHFSAFMNMIHHIAKIPIFLYWWVLWWYTFILPFCQHLRIRYGIPHCQVLLFVIHEYNMHHCEKCIFSPFMNMMMHLCQTVIFRHSWIWWCTTAKKCIFSIHNMAHHCRTVIFRHLWIW